MWPDVKTTAVLFLGACVFRLLNTFLVQSFFDPDEYWQSLEPAYCEVFLKDAKSSTMNMECAGYTWDWKRRAPGLKSPLSWLDDSLQGPIRSYLSVLPVHAFYSLLAHWELDSHFWVSQGPKLLMAIVSAAPTDISVWLLGHWLDKKKNSRDVPYFCLFCSMVNWFNGYAMVRTFSNSIEAMLLTTSMVLLAPELLGDELYSPYSTLRHCLCFLMGGCSVAMRVSSISAWFPMGILLATQSYLRNKQSLRPALVVVFRTCALFGGLGIGIACVVDRYFYGFWTIPFLGCFHFNVVLGHATLYGSHPWHWYLTAGIPAITGLWLPFVLWDFWLMVSGSREECSNGRRNVWVVILVVTAAHSLSGHKEFRYLLPILPLFCLRSGPHIRSFILALSRWHRGTSSPVPAFGSSSIPWLILLTIPNLVALLYLGLFHQSAPISVSHKIAAIAAQRHNQVDAKAPSVHYLTGACHSTPLHSYLHVPGSVRFSTWSLDCSPECRTNPNVLCESEQFATDPITFWDDAYGLSAACQAAASDQETSCSAQRTPPDFLVTYADYAIKLSSRIRSMGLEEVGRFPHGINGLRLGSLLKSGDGYQVKDGMTLAELDATYHRVQLLGDLLELSIDEMVLFAAPA